MGDKLTAQEVKGAKYEGKPFKLYDRDGLYLLVNASGRYWRFDYRFLKKRKTLAIGVYPEMSLGDARDKTQEARGQIKAGFDPCHIKKTGKMNLIESADKTFENVSKEWLLKQKWTDGHRRTVESRLENDVWGWIGGLPIEKISAKEVLLICRRIEGRGAIETAHRVKTVCSQVFRYAVACGIVENDPCRDLRNALTPVVSKHMASITDPEQIGGLLRALSDYKGYEVTRAAMQLAPLVFVRPGELRKAEWEEFDLDQGLWKIPGERMKMKAPHIVPLSRQALEIINGLKPYTGHGQYLFPSARTTSRPMSDNAVLSALRRMGIPKEEMTGHGFRSMFSTRFHEMGWPSHLIERQLAHREKNDVKAAYNFAEYLPARKVMMQAWSDYLDDLRDTGKADINAYYFYENYQTQGMNGRQQGVIQFPIAK